MVHENEHKLKVKWITVCIEELSEDRELEQFLFGTDSGNRYFIDLRPENRSSELVAVSLVRDAFLHQKELNITYETRAGRRWVKQLNIY